MAEYREARGYDYPPSGNQEGGYYDPNTGMGQRAPAAFGDYDQVGTSVLPTALSTC